MESTGPPEHLVQASAPVLPMAVRVAVALPLAQSGTGETLMEPITVCG